MQTQTPDVGESYAGLGDTVEVGRRGFAISQYYRNVLCHEVGLLDRAENLNVFTVADVCFRYCKTPGATDQ